MEDEIVIAKYSLRNIIPSGRPVEKKDVDKFIAAQAEKPGRKNKKNKGDEMTDNAETT